MPVERPQAKNLEAWYQRLKERPGFARNVALPLT
jgi:glutathione S-transferase